MNQKQLKVTKNEAERDLIDYKGLEVLFNSKDGQKLISAIVGDMIAYIERLGSQYDTLTEMQMRVIGAEIGTKLSLLKVFTNAPINVKMAEEYLIGLKEENADE